MAITLKWLGHGSWALTIGKHRVLLDPFLDDSPTAPVKSGDVEADFILVSHGHFDHIADVGKIAKRCQSTVVAIFEVAEWLGKNEKLEKLQPMNLGGSVAMPFGRVKMTPAWHSAQLPDGSSGGNPAGFVLECEGKRIYFACDTALFSDMRLIGEPELDVAVLPIGDLFTMGPKDSLLAIQWLRPKHVLPAHYNTWPPIEQDANEWALQVRSDTEAKPVVLEPGQEWTLP
jgi:L-ascorbate metabolism protein UlaG (beta-lactamase superfamily)